MTNGVSTLLRLGSRIVCLIVLVSFVLFAIEQADSASVHQQRELSEGTPTASTKHSGKHDKSTLRKTIDEVSSEITSPFSAATAGWKNEWAIRGTLTVLALLVYGFGIGFLARALRVRV